MTFQGMLKKVAEALQIPLEEIRGTVWGVDLVSGADLQIAMGCSVPGKSPGCPMQHSRLASEWED